MSTLAKWGRDVADELSNEEISWLLSAYERRTTAALMPARFLTRLLRLGLLEQKLLGPGISEAGKELLEQHGYVGHRQLGRRKSL